MRNIHKPMVSVIVPTKNEEKLLPGCLQSLRLQKTAYPWELIVVDTNSTDKTVPIAKKYGARIVRESRPGKSRGVQSGAEQAFGAILLFTEADCRVPPHWIDHMVKTFQNNSQIIAITSGHTFIEKDAHPQFLHKFFFPIGVWAYRIFFGHHSLRGTNFAIRKDIFRKIGGFNIRTLEFHDVDLGIRASKYGTISYIPGLKISTSNRRVHKRTIQFFLEFIRGFFQVCVLRHHADTTIYTDIR